jgi:hypothetical protein
MVAALSLRVTDSHKALAHLPREDAEVGFQRKNSTKDCFSGAWL